jgi:hypothetical protein
LFYLRVGLEGCGKVFFKSGAKTVEARGVVDQQAGAREVVGRNLEEKLEECLVGERLFEVNVGPVGAPEDPLRGSLHEGPGEGGDGSQVSPLCESIRAAELNPTTAAANQFEQGAKGGLQRSERRIHTSHVVDHHLDRTFPHKPLDSSYVDCVNVQFQVPAERLNPPGELPTVGFVEAFGVEVPDVVDPRAANPLLVQVLQRRIRCGRFHQGNAPAIIGIPVDRGQHCPVILPVRTALDEHSAFDAESLPKPFQGLGWRQRRLEGGRRAEGEPVEGPVDVGVTVASADRNRPAGLGEIYGVDVGGVSTLSGLSAR